MPTIVSNNNAQFTVTLMRDGAAVAVPVTAAVQAQLMAIDGVTPLAAAAACASTDAGAVWSSGVVAVSFAAAATASAVPPACVLLVTVTGGVGGYAEYRFKLDVAAVGAVTRSSLFIKDLIVSELRQDRLMMAAQGALPGLTVTDDYLWEKVRAAEAATARDLRVPLVPTAFFVNPPSAEDLAPFPAGIAWDIDPAYDYDPSFFQGDKWGFLVTRQKPIIQVTQIQFAYPNPMTAIWSIPLDWIRMDQRFGHIRFVPATSAFSAPLSAFMLQALGGGKVVPFMIQISYSAGLTDAWTNWPDVIEVIKKRSVLKVIQDVFLPQSGSISADGLSQSISVDMDKYHDMIDTMLYGPKGTNGGLMTAIHGVRTTVLGG